MSPDELYARAVAACEGPQVKAWRVVGELEPDMGQGAPIAPPLYGDSGSTITERVCADGQREKTIVLDSIPSQANRAEAALAAAVEAGLLPLPMLELTIGTGRTRQVARRSQASSRCSIAREIPTGLVEVVARRSRASSRCSVLVRPGSQGPKLVARRSRASSRCSYVPESSPAAVATVARRPGASSRCS